MQCATNSDNEENTWPLSKLTNYQFLSLKQAKRSTSQWLLLNFTWVAHNSDDFFHPAPTEAQKNGNSSQVVI